MLRSVKLHLLICWMMLSLFTGIVKGEESRAARLLHKAVEYSLDGDPDWHFERAAFLYACDHHWAEAEQTIAKIEDEDWKNMARLEVTQAAILSGKEGWAVKLAPKLDWTEDYLTTTRSLHAAAQGNFEKAIQLADQVESQYMSHQLYCELARDFGNRGELKHANELFLRALAQEETGASMTLFDAAFATRYRPLIQEMYRRNYDEAERQSESYVDDFLYNAATVYAKHGFVAESFDSLSRIHSQEERRSTQEELFDIFIEDGNAKGAEQLIASRLESDPSCSLADDLRVQVINLNFRQKEWKAAERDIWRLKDNFLKANEFANLSIQLFAAGDSKSAKHKCSVAGQVVALAYSEQIKNNYKADFELWGKYVAALSREAVALHVTGDIEKSETIMQKALKIGHDRSSRFGSPFDDAAPEILDAFQKLGKTAEAHEFVIRILASRAYRANDDFVESDPLAKKIKFMLKEYGLKAVQEYVHIIRNIEQRYLLSDIVGQIQLQVEGPDADLDWIDKLQKANAQGSIYLREAERELAPQIKKMETQIERIQPFPRGAGCIFFGL